MGNVEGLEIGGFESGTVRVNGKVAHLLVEPKQLRYPGGKNGMWEAGCTCGYRTSPHATAAAATKPANAHIAAQTEE